MENFTLLLMFLICLLSPVALLVFIVNGSIDIYNKIKSKLSCKGGKTPSYIGKCEKAEKKD